MNQEDKPWQTLDSNIVYKNPWMKVIEDKTRMPNGKEGIYGYIDGGSGVFIIAINADDEIYLIESFRYPSKKWQWELPTGGLNADSAPLDAAKNELLEELGLTADEWIQLSTYTPSHNGFMKDTQHVFIAKNLTEGESRLGDFEAIRAVKKVSFSELVSMINEGSLADGQTLAAIMQYVAWREKHTR